MKGYTCGWNELKGDQAHIAAGWEDMAVNGGCAAKLTDGFT
jgi:hypothetical protein